MYHLISYVPNLIFQVKCSPLFTSCCSWFPHAINVKLLTAVLITLHTCSTCCKVLSSEPKSSISLTWLSSRQHRNKIYKRTVKHVVIGAEEFRLRVCSTIETNRCLSWKIKSHPWSIILFMIPERCNGFLLSLCTTFGNNPFQTHICLKNNKRYRGQR